MDRKKYERTVPSGRVKLLTVNVHGRTVEDVVAALRVHEDRVGHPRCYADRDGNVVIAVDNWQS